MAIDVNKRVLVLEDVKDVRETLEISLKLQGYEVSACESVPVAKRVLRRRAHRVAIVDISMVDPDPENEEGTELLREISCRYRGDPMNAIVLTGFGTVKRTRDAFKDYKVFDYVEKGGSLDQLLDTVKNAIDDATKREPENVFVENGEPQSFYGEVASILTDDGGRQSDLAGQVLFLLQSLCDTFSLNPLHVPAKAFTLPQTRGWFAIFPVWSRSLERLLLIVVGTGDLLDPRATQWVARRQWQLTAIGTARSVSLRAACYAVEGATYDDFFDAEI